METTCEELLHFNSLNFTSTTHFIVTSLTIALLLLFLYAFLSTENIETFFRCLSLRSHSRANKKSSQQYFQPVDVELKQSKHGKGIPGM